MRRSPVSPAIAGQPNHSRRHRLLPPMPFQPLPPPRRQSTRPSAAAPEALPNPSDFLLAARGTGDARMSDGGFEFGLGDMADTIRETTQRFTSDKITPIAAEIDST